MKFLCLVYGGDCIATNHANGSGEKVDPQEVNRYIDLLRQTGHFIAAAPLNPSGSVSHLSARHDGVSVTDGPFAETKEVLAGFFLIQAADRAEAERVIAKSPHARTATVEIRELLEMGNTESRMPRSREPTRDATEAHAPV